MQNLNDNLLVKNQTHRLSKHLRILSQIFTSLESFDHFSEVFGKFSTLLNELILFNSLQGCFYDAKSDTVDWVLATDENQLEKRILKSEEDEIVSLAICGKETVYSNLVQKKVFSLNKDKASCLSENRILSEASIVAPIVVKDEVFGVIRVRSHDQDLFTEPDASLISIVASQCGIAFESSIQKTEIAENERLQSMVELANSLGHELNQPLTGITGYCALIKEDLKESDSIYNDIVEIEKQAKRLEKLVYKFQNLLYLENKSVDD